MEIECSTDIDAKTPDGILGFYSKDKGKENEGLLGIITSWDIPEIYNKLSV